MADPLSTTASVATLIDGVIRLIRHIESIRCKDETKESMLIQLAQTQHLLDIIQQDPLEIPEPVFQRELINANSILQEAKGVLRAEHTGPVRKILRAISLSDLKKSRAKISLLGQKAEYIRDLYSIHVGRLQGRSQQDAQVRVEFGFQEFRHEFERLRQVLHVDGSSGLQTAVPIFDANITSRHVPNLLNQAPKQDNLEGQASTSETRKTLIGQLRQRSDSRSSFYNCVCHQYDTITLSTSLQRVCGVLFVSYASLPIVSPRRNSCPCLSCSTVMLRIQYRPPGWFVARFGWCFTFGLPFGSPQCSMTVTLPVPIDSALFHAAACGDEESMKALFSYKKASPMDVCVSDGRSALHTAVNMAQWRICELLLSVGADPYLMDDDGLSPMAMAREKCLLRVYQKERFYIASIFTDEACLDELQYTVLHRLVIGLENGDLQAESHSMSSILDSTDSSGNTALLCAIKCGDLNAASILLDKGANPNISDKAERSPLHYVGRCKQPSLITALIDCGADIHKKSKWKSSTLHFACVQGDDDVGFVKLLIDAGMDLEDINYQNRTVLSEAAKYDRLSVATLLLDLGADRDHESSEGETPLMEAITHNSTRCLSLFLEKNARYHGTNRRGNTVLHLAALTGTPRTLEILTRAGLRDIDVTSRNIDGYTAIEIAQERHKRQKECFQGFLDQFYGLLRSI